VRKREKKLARFYAGVFEYKKDLEKYFSLDRW